jgi:hypothetical protein
VYVYIYKRLCYTVFKKISHTNTEHNMAYPMPDAYQVELSSPIVQVNEAHVFFENIYSVQKVCK